jgi:threonine dehydrogenase-like Zn-dependent dehydrogenase
MRGIYCDGTSIGLRKDLPVPEPLPGEVRLRVRAVGICDTDLQLAKGYMGFRGVLGHEFVGVDAERRRYTAEINNGCLDCPACRADNKEHCPNRTVLGILKHDGAMAEWVCVPRGNLHAIPDAIDDRRAVFVEPLAAAFRLHEQVDFDPGQRVAVLGDGKLGALCVWTLKAAQLDVTWIGKHDEKLAIAGDGVTTCRLDRSEGLSKSFPVVIDATGSPSGLEAALLLVRPQGLVVLKTTVASPHNISLAPIVIDEVRLIGSRCGPFAPAIDALATGEIDVGPLIEAVYPLTEGEEAFRHAARPGARKVLMECKS